MVLVSYMYLLAYVSIKGRNMKFKAFLVALLLMSLFIVHAFEEVTEAETKARKKKELDALAERFKAETGFTGDIIQDYDNYKMRVLRGKFSDISFPNLTDTLAIRRECDAIVEMIIPYIGCPSLTLTKTFIGYNNTSMQTYYQQLVHGFGFEWSGGLSIDYTSDMDRVKIVDGIIRKDIPPARVKYTFPQAVEIARQHYINVLGYPDTLSFKNPNSNDLKYPGSLFLKTIYYNGTKYVYDKGQYVLCHIFGISVPYGIAGYRAAYIDAQTGEVFKIVDDSIH
jgi:hypothetical protein